MNSDPPKPCQFCGTDAGRHRPDCPLFGDENSPPDDLTADQRFAALVRCLPGSPYSASNPAPVFYTPRPPPAYTVPPFNATPRKRYVWWSWHPSHPQETDNGWKETVWNGDTGTETMAGIDNLPHSHHCKLMRQDGAHYTEVLDLPCRRPEQWHEYKANVQRRTASPP